MEMSIDSMLIQATELGASDLHIQARQPPIIRRNGALQPLPGRPPLAEDLVSQLLAPLVSDEMKKDFSQEKSLDFSHGIEGVARFRVNMFVQRGQTSAAFRRIPEDIPTLADLGAPAILAEFARAPRGMVLVTGPTGSGKSTTLAAVLRLINETRRDHILTIEDPVEFVHSARNCMVTQREVGKDCPSFARGLRDALRQDPDVILVGEMRDVETMRIAMTAAETGHLVFATLHTSSAPSAIDRIVDAFPGEEQQQIRTMLGGSLLGVVTQALLPRSDGSGRVAAHEVMVANNPVKALIREGKTEHLRNELQTKLDAGMYTLDRALVHLVVNNVISEDVARDRAQSLSEFDQLLNAVRSGRPIKPPALVQHGQGTSTAG